MQYKKLDYKKNGNLCGKNIAALGFNFIIIFYKKTNDIQINF